MLTLIFPYPKCAIKRNLAVAGILFILFLTASKTYGEEFQRALPGKVFFFPQDHYSHPEFKTEWWYYTGHLQSEDRKTYGYQLTFFRVAFRRSAKGGQSKWAIQDLYFAHLALTDEAKKRFEYREKMSRGSFGEAGASIYGSKEPLRVWIDDWSMELRGIQLQNHLLKAGGKDFGIELQLAPEKNAVIHGKNGVSQKAEGEGFASHYYSITRLMTEGKIFLKGKEFAVRGMSWMDHEFGSNQLRQYQIGWDWFSIQLDNGVDLMLYQIRHQDGKPDPYSSGTIIFPDGRSNHLPLKEFQIDSLDRWKSPKSKATYPSRWKIKVPRYGIELNLSPTIKDQELITEDSTRVTYWEGSVKIEGKYQNISVKAKGYVEMTGYVKPFSKGI